MDEYYGDEGLVAEALAKALNMELKALQVAGAHVVQIDEPGFRSRFSLACRLGSKLLQLIASEIRVPIIVHCCYGYVYEVEAKEATRMYGDVLKLLAASEAVSGISLEYEQPKHNPDILRHCGRKHAILGLLDLGTTEVESETYIAQRLLDASKVVPADRLHPSSDCGMWHVPREVAFGKISALVRGTISVREMLGI